MDRPGEPGADHRHFRRGVRVPWLNAERVVAVLDTGDTRTYIYDMTPDDAVFGPMQASERTVTARAASAAGAGGAPAGTWCPDSETGPPGTSARSAQLAPQRDLVSA